MRLQNLTSNFETHFKQLKDLYFEMSSNYQAVADQYEFSCRECPDNCCRTRFYNHTYIEYFYLMEGLAGLSGKEQESLVQKARGVCEEIAAINGRGEPPRVMCPVNEEGLCTLYEFRPMICRLHGIPYDLQFPGRDPVRGEACTEFTKRALSDQYIPFDRTPLYKTLSQLEGELRSVTGKTRKIKMTIAEMIAFDPDDPLKQ